MGADTLVTSSTIGNYESKILPITFDDGVAICGLAGNPDLAAAAIEQCEISLRTSMKKSRTCVEIASHIKRVLTREYKEKIMDHGLQDTGADYVIIAAIFSEADGLGLYSTYKSSMKRSRSGIEFAGAGYDVAKLLSGPWFRSKQTHQDHALVHIISNLKFIKDAMPGVIGGNSVIVRLREDGELAHTRRDDMDIVERYSARFRHASDALLNKFLRIGEDKQAEFDGQLDMFTQALCRAREEWRKESSRIIFSAPVAEALELLETVNNRARPFKQAGK